MKGSHLLGRLTRMALSGLLVCTLGLTSLVFPANVSAAERTDETGYDLWLRYAAITDTDYVEEVYGKFSSVVKMGEGLVLSTAAEELEKGLSSMLGQKVFQQTTITQGALLLATADQPVVASFLTVEERNALTEEGFQIVAGDYEGQEVTLLVGGGEKGVLYGAFRLLEKIACEEDPSSFYLADAPAIDWRVLDQWDNWSGSIERGYAGRSIYKWSELPGVVDPRYKDFARANASVGINTIVINNVNTQVDYLKPENLEKVAAIADVFRPYGIRLALTVRFDSPKALGGLSTADPLDATVIQWWKDKFDEIYTRIPDFAGVLVKADSEGQSGPSTYGRTHAQGANMLAGLLAPHDAIVMWRTFVYGAVASSISSDICLQQYGFFMPLDGQFDDNVIVQCKNGPRDFLPNEPVNPLIGGMVDTNVGMELQITQEYTGQSTHVCYLVSMWKEYLTFDTHTTAENADTSKGTTVDRILDGTVYDRPVTMMAGVANIGNDTNWTRLELAQANWYGFGKLAWNPRAEEEEITDNWIKLTFGTDEEVVKVLRDILMSSWEIYCSYSSPYGLGMVMGSANHYDLDPFKRNGSTIKVDASGIGFIRNSSGSTDQTAQYFPENQAIFDNIETCPEELLFWFHHVPFDFVMKNGRTMIQNVYNGYYSGVAKVQDMKEAFVSLEGKIDNARFKSICNSFDKQIKDAGVWRDTMVSFFKAYSGVEPELYVYKVVAPELNTLVGYTPALPGQVQAWFPDGTYKMVSVRWEDIPESFDQAGDMEIIGVAEQEGMSVTLTVHVLTEVTPGVTFFYGATDLTALARHLGKVETLDDQYRPQMYDLDGSDGLSAEDLTGMARQVARI